MANPNTRESLKQYCLRALGKPVIEINVDDDQLEDRLDESLQYFAQYHTDGIRRTYLKYKLTSDDKTRLKNATRSSESATDLEESGVSTTHVEQDNYLVIPDSVISVTNIFPFSDKGNLTTLELFHSALDYWCFFDSSIYSLELGLEFICSCHLLKFFRLLSGVRSTMLEAKSIADNKVMSATVYLFPATYSEEENSLSNLL